MIRAAQVEFFVRRLEKSVVRLRKFIELNAPQIFIDKELKLMRRWSKRVSEELAKAPKETLEYID